MQKQAVLWGAFVGCGLGLSAWAEAKPVRTMDAQTGNMSIIDKSTGQKVFMTHDKIIYSDKYSKWSKMYSDADIISSIFLDESALFVSFNHNTQRIEKYNLKGELLLKIKIDDGDVYIEDFPNERYLSYNIGVSQAMQATYYFVADKETGKVSEIPGDLLAIVNNIFISRAPVSSYGIDPDEVVRQGFDLNMRTTGYRVGRLGQKGNSLLYETLPRKNCQNFKPNLDEMYKIVGNQGSWGLNNILVQKKYGRYMENVVRGEYIYAHRADHCGKFTYRFHWTDLKHPSPVILEGWK